MEPVLLTDQINKSTVQCLNEDKAFPITNALFQTNSDLVVKSEDDAELLLQFEFIQPVKLSKILIEAPNTEEQPKKVKLFANKVNMSFDDAEQHAATHEFNFSQGEIKERVQINLPFVKFQRVHSLTLFVENNFSESFGTTTIANIQFYGFTGETVDVNNFNKQEQEK